MNHLKRGNLLWEGSRMVLPEHREALLDRQRDRNKHDMPELDPDQQALIDQAIAMSLQTKSEITLTVYDPEKDRRVTGYVVRVDQYRGRVLVQREDGDEWIDRARVLAVDG